MTHPVIITRPGPGARNLAERLKEALGPSALLLLSPLLRIDSLGEQLPDMTGFRGLVVTSAQAVVPLAHDAHAAKLPCYCVGTATARAARSLGLKAIEGGGDADRLLERIKMDMPEGPLLYARGEHVSTDLAKSLNLAGIETHEAVVYRQEPLDLTEEAQQLLNRGDPVVVPLFSARTARLFFAQNTATRRCASLRSAKWSPWKYQRSSLSKLRSPLSQRSTAWLPPSARLRPTLSRLRVYLSRARLTRYLKDRG